MVKNNVEVDIEKCKEVVKLREDSRWRIEEVGCSADEEVDARTQFQICSHNTTTQLYEDLINMISETEVEASICEAFDDLSGECFDNLLVCFHPTDLVMMKKQQFEKIISYLSSSLKRNISKVKIFKCPVVKEVLERESHTLFENEELKASKKSEREISSGGSNLMSYTDTLISILLTVFYT